MWRAGELRVALYGDSANSNVDTTAVRRLRKKALLLQLNVSRATAIMALGLCEDSEERAEDLITALPDTKRFIQFLANPALATDIDVQNLGSAQVRKVEECITSKELDAAKEQLEGLWTTAMAEHIEDATNKIQKQEKAEAKLAIELLLRKKKYPKNRAGRTAFLPVGTRVLSMYGTQFNTWYPGKIAEILNEGEVFVHTHTRAHTHANALARARAHTHTQTHTHAPTCTHMPTHTCTNTHTHTHTHTHKGLRLGLGRRRPEQSQSAGWLSEAADGPSVLEPVALPLP